MEGDVIYFSDRFILHMPHGLLITQRGHRDNQFNAAADILRTYGDKGRLTFRKGLHKDETIVEYLVGEMDTRDPYVQL